MRVVFACAGTGGHVNPAIAIANIIKRKDKNAQILFIGTETGLENKLVKNAGYEIRHISTGKIIRSITLKNINAITKNLKGIKEAKNILKEFNPDLVIGTGGYICGPVMIAARKFKIPYVLHESNAFPGVTIKLLAKKAAKVMIGFEDARARLKNRENIIYTGTPAKFNEETFEALDKNTCKKELNLLDINKKIILVTCGSQGARKINTVVLDMVKKYLNEDIYIILVSGDKNYNDVVSQKETIEEELKKKLDNFVRVEKFVYDMDKMYKSVDLCITRSGAMTITELALAGKPSILIPLPTAAENHQLYNAKVLGDVGAATIIEQKYLNEDTLNDAIFNMLNADSLEKMSVNAKKVKSIDVEEKIYDCVKDSLKK